MSAWTLFPHIIVRTTGFPFDNLEAIRFVGAANAARRLDWELSGFEKYKATAKRIHRPPKQLLSLLKAGKPIPADLSPEHGMFDEWNMAAEAALAASIEFEETFNSDEKRTAATIERLCADPRFLEAIASSSPPVFVDIRKGKISNRVQRQLGSYIQRFSAKNETMSFFGPINYGMVDEGLPSAVELSWSGPKTVRRRTYAASWLVQLLYKTIAFLPEVAPWLVFRKKGFAEAPARAQRRGRLGDVLIQMGVVTPDQVKAALAQQATTSTRRRFGEILVDAGMVTREVLDRALESIAIRGIHVHAVDDEDVLPMLVEAADGTRNVQSLAERLKRTTAEVLRYAKIGCERGFLSHQLEIPAGSHRPMDDLIDRLAAIPGPVARAQLLLVGQIVDRMAVYGKADAGEKVRLNDELRTFVRTQWAIESAVSAPAVKDAANQARRGEGHNFYSDRLPMREECGGDLKLTVGGDRAREIVTRCDRALELMAYAAVATRAASRRVVAEMLGPRELPLWKVLTVLADRPIPYDTTVSSLVMAQIQNDQLEEVRLDGLVIPALPEGADDLPVATSVDLLIAANSVEDWSLGKYEITMGDVHDTILVWGWALQFHEDRTAVETQMLRALGNLKREIPLVTALSSRRTGLIPSEFPGPVVEVGGVSGRSSHWRMPLDDLLVRSDGKLATLYSQSLQSEVALYNGELESILHTAFALPRIRPIRVSMTPHTPRLMLDGVVLQREQWKLSPEAAAPLLAALDDRSRLRIAMGIWAELGLPEYVFAKFKGERKPLLVDPRSPLLLRVFTNMLGQHGEVWLSEMRPGPDGLWLQNEGQRFTSELRCTFLRGARPPG